MLVGGVEIRAREEGALVGSRGLLVGAVDTGEEDGMAVGLMGLLVGGVDTGEAEGSFEGETVLNSTSWEGMLEGCSVSNSIAAGTISTSPVVIDKGGDVRFLVGRGVTTIL